jgi:hypothetical protein
VNERPPRLPAEQVQTFVGVAHGDLQKVKEMMADTPALINAAWDWGGGDWETALGAAGHMGRRDIAEFLLANGARFELPAAAMLGQLEAVRAVIDANPDLRAVAGPHGIPLLVHAEMGGEPALGVLAYLESLG